MRDELIAFLKKLSSDLKGTFVSVNIPDYVDKIQEFATIISISKNSEIKAFIAFYENDKHNEIAYLTMLAVCKDCWHLGYGKQLLEFSINDIKKKGFKLYRLEVKADNLNAIKLYKTYGFIATGVENGSVNMEKQL
jgi:ribosomal protein S18 acetylase RimI-like enzyme